MARRSGGVTSKPRVKVGDRVYFRFYPTPMEAEVIEDRGDLGRDGEQIVRVRYTIECGSLFEPDPVEETELPVSRLVPPPDPNAAPQGHSRRRRRPAPA
jgi:hypothetical protein